MQNKKTQENYEYFFDIFLENSEKALPLQRF